MSEREIVVITGGARSGKSRIALEVAAQDTPKLFIATCEPLDNEIRSRISKHKEERGASWTTMEEPVLITPILQQQTAGVVLIDCMTLWLSNLLMREATDGRISAMVSELCEAAQQREGLTILVTNETGMGIVPDNALARRFRDLAGIMNQYLARTADTVICAISGLPLYLKSRSKR
jgi:adenosylcobinamide kinase / adenosylcobinamide-phosphate guanylyltransferase